MYEKGIIFVEKCKNICICQKKVVTLRTFFEDFQILTANNNG